LLRLWCRLFGVRWPWPARAADIPAAPEVAILQIRVLEGDGAIHALARAPAGRCPCNHDETGKPVEGAAVSFRLPDDGPGGVFASA